MTWEAASSDDKQLLGRRWQVCVDGISRLPLRLLTLQWATLLLHGACLVAALRVLCDGSLRRPPLRHGYCLATGTLLYGLALGADVLQLWLIEVNVFESLPRVARPLEYAAAITDLVMLVLFMLGTSRVCCRADDERGDLRGARARVVVARSEMAQPMLGNVAVDE